MARQHGITSTTYQNLIIDAGAVYANYGIGNEALLGATRGGNKFAIETEYKDLEVDGAKGPVIGSRIITKVTARLTANFVQFSTALLKLALPGSSSANYPTISPTHDSITRALQIVTANFQGNIALLGQVSGKTYPCVCIIKNAICDGNLELNEKHADEAVLAIQFTGHFDPSTMDAEPWEIRYPQS